MRNTPYIFFASSGLGLVEEASTKPSGQVEKSRALSNGGGGGGGGGGGEGGAFGDQGHSPHTHTNLFCFLALHRIIPST